MKDEKEKQKIIFTCNRIKEILIEIYCVCKVDFVIDWEKEEIIFFIEDQNYVININYDSPIAALKDIYKQFIMKL